MANQVMACPHAASGPVCRAMTFRVADQINFKASCSLGNCGGLVRLRSLMPRFSIALVVQITFRTPVGKSKNGIPRIPALCHAVRRLFGLRDGLIFFTARLR
jgi:hypothetical protein